MNLFIDPKRITDFDSKEKIWQRKRSRLRIYIKGEAPNLGSRFSTNGSFIWHKEIFFIKTIFKLFYFCLFIFGCAGSSLLLEGFLSLQQMGTPLVVCASFSLQWLLFFLSKWSRVWLPSLTCVGSAVIAHGALLPHRIVRSFLTRDQIHVPCIDRRILNH